MPENGGFDLGSLSSLLQNEETVRALRQMAGVMGLGTQLEGALQNIPSSNTGSGAPQTVGGNGSENTAPVSASLPPIGANGYAAANSVPNDVPSSAPNSATNNAPNNAQPGTVPPGIPGMEGLFSNPALLGTLSRVMQAMNQQGPEYIFLKSLKPLLRPEKAPKVDQALQIMQMVKALESVEGGALGAGAGMSGLAGLLGLGTGNR